MEAKGKKTFRVLFHDGRHVTVQADDYRYDNTRRHSLVFRVAPNNDWVAEFVTDDVRGVITEAALISGPNIYIPD